jgi:hypothetical protein
MRIAFLFLLWIGLQAVPWEARAATEIPFRYQNGMIWVKVKFAQREQPLNFLLDSGAGESVLDLQTARQLRLKLGWPESVQGVEGRCSAGRVRGLVATVGRLPIAKTMLAIDLSAVSRGCPQRIDGLLGLDFFQGRIVQIDYAARKIRILERGDASAAAQIIPLQQRNHAVCVSVSVNGNPPQSLRLDTGCSSALEWVPGRTAARRTRSISIAAARGSRPSVATQVRLGSTHFSDVETGLHPRPMFAGESGLLGNRLLEKFRVTIDLAQSELRLSQSK